MFGLRPKLMYVTILIYGPFRYNKDNGLTVGSLMCVPSPQNETEEFP